jgi:outer membrane protein
MALFLQKVNLFYVFFNLLKFCFAFISKFSYNECVIKITNKKEYYFMKKLGLIAVLAVFANIANAQIAVVDTQYVFENANITKQVNDELMALTKEIKDGIKKDEDALAKKQEALMAKKSVLSQDVYSKQETELKQEIMEFRKRLKQSQKDLNIKNKQKKQEIAEKISKAVDDIAKKNNYDAVISKTFLMYNKETLEITEKVLAEVNTQE